jgi:hypothetical protein
MDNADKKKLKEMVEDYWVDNVLDQLIIVLHEKADEWQDMGMPSNNVKQCSKWAEEIAQFMKRMRSHNKPL